MRTITLKNHTGAVVSVIKKVTSCETNERLVGEKTLRFATLLDESFSDLQVGRKYTAEFDGDLYDVVSFKKTMNGDLSFIDISCEHISYRLNGYQKETFTATGSPTAIVEALLEETEFSVGSGMPQNTVTYSIQKSATVRAILLDFAATFGYDIIFEGMTVSFSPHRGRTDYRSILRRNVLNISKSVSLTDDKVSYSLGLRPEADIGIGDEVHLKFSQLGIDDYVRVLGVRRQPFVNNNVTLEVGAFLPDMASESVRIVTNMLAESKAYYGTRISADKGLEINRGDGNAKVVFNADKMAFYQGDEEILYFDPVARKWRMSSNIELHVKGDDGQDTTFTAYSEGLTTRIRDADNHYVEIKETLDGLTVTTEQGQTLIDGGMIVTDNVRLHRLIAKNSPNSYVEMMTNGLNFVLGNANTIGIGYASSDIPLPYIIFGEGASPSSDDVGMIKFYDGGLWVGDSADRHSTTIQNGTGLFVDVPNDRVYIYVNGEPLEISNREDVRTLINALRTEMNNRFDNFKPTAVFG